MSKARGLSSSEVRNLIETPTKEEIMVRYHDSGTICEATQRACPLGLSDSDHIEANLFECGLEILENGQLKSSNRRSVHRARTGFGDRPVTLIREEFVEGSLQGVVYLPVLSNSFLASFKCEPRWSPVFYSAEKLLSDMAPQEPF